MLAKTRLGLENKDKTAKLDEISKSYNMPHIMKQPIKQLRPSSDSHNSKFALVNYESNSQMMDQHTENQFSTFNMSPLHWMDMLEIVLIIAAGLLFLKYFRRYLKKRKQKAEAKRQAQLLSTIQGSIPLSPLPVNPTFASAPVPMLEDKSTVNAIGSGSSVFKIYKP